MNPIRCLWRTAALLLFVSTSTALAQTIYVDISDADVIDVDPNTATVADLPGPDGHISYGEALIAANNTPGRQTIGFRIPTSDWTYLAWYYPGRAVVHGFGWPVYDEVTIDGRTQTAFTGDTNPNGWEVVIVPPISFIADNCTLLGVDSSSVSVDGSNALIEGNTGTMGIEIIGASSGGSGSVVRGNTAAWIQIDRSNDNVVVGNTVQRVRVLGWYANNQPATNNRIGGPALADRNFITGLGTLNSQGIPNGFAVQLFDSLGTVIENNRIGTTPDGMQPGHPYTTVGISFDGENHDTTIRANLIAGILAHAIPPQGPGYSVGTAISLYGAGNGVSIVGNKIGLNAADQPVLGSVTGITTTNYYLGPISSVVVGGTAAGEGNEIAGHLFAGVLVANTYTDVRISGNSIHDNGALGIDLVTGGFQTGVTLNDPLDVDTGGNGLQNFPVLQSATLATGSLRVVGSLNSSASTPFTIELFASSACDTSGFGEGRVFLGSTSLTTDFAGNGDFDALLHVVVPASWVVTATATREPTGASSEFSACISLSGSAGESFCAGDGTSGACPCGNSGLPGHGCQNSVGSGGSLLTDTGAASLSSDTLQFQAAGELPTALSIILQGDIAIAPANFGDGLRCAGGALKRLYVKNASGGVVSAPETGDPSVSVRSAAQGDTIPAGATRIYQVYYRDPSASFCPAPVGNTFNVSNAVAVVWGF
jgi:hypothetical protein